MYNAQSSGVTVKLLAVPFDAYADKITAAVPRGRGPDVFIYAQDRLGGWVEGGQTIEPIDFFIEDETLDQLLPNMMDAMTYRGTVYGLPLNYKSITLIYNKKLVPSPPSTSAELVDVAKRLTNVAVGKFGVAYEYSNLLFSCRADERVWRAVFDADANPTIDRRKTSMRSRLMLEWYREDGIPSGGPLRDADQRRCSTTGNAAMVFSGPWFLAEMQTRDRLRPRAPAEARTRSAASPCGHG
jgi:arabinogalactan oligomer / maltooligosaccharide transport system substrate-binding protein